MSPLHTFLSYLCCVALIVQSASMTGVDWSHRLVAHGVMATTSTFVRGVLSGGDPEVIKAAALQAIGTAIATEGSLFLGQEYHSGDMPWAAHKVAHGLVGCVSGAVMGLGTEDVKKKCIAGAAGAAFGEIVGEKYLQGQVPALIHGDVSEPDLIQQTGNVARLAGGFVAGAAGGNVNIGAQTGGVAAENNAIQFVPIMLTAAFVAAVHSAAVGISALVDSDGNPLEALRKSGRHEDSLTVKEQKLQEKIAESSFGKMVANGKAEISRVAYEAFPEQIDSINRGLERLNNGLGLVLTYADLLTGERISRFWKDVPLAVKEALAGLTRLAPAAAGLGFGGKILTNFIISKDVTKMVGAGRRGLGRAAGAGSVPTTARLTSENAQALSSAGKMIDTADRGGELTKAGRALQKHGGREGSAFPPAKGNPAAVNEQGQKILEDIVYDPKHEIKHGNRFDGFDIFDSQGRGARFDANSNFRGFLEPKQ